MDGRIEIELYQAEWCPYSARVRRRLTDLGVDFVAHQVERDPEHRDHLREVSGQTEIPVLVAGPTLLCDTDEILDWLECRYREAAA
jgi:glutathione S-transferase